jgi:signal transduction histidine kinase
MGSLLDSLLEYSRIGRAELDLTDFTLGDVVEEARELLEDRLARAGAQIELSDAETPLRGDRVRVRQALVNLISNGVKYGEGDVRVYVRDGAICVSDDGIGIAPEHHDVIFNVFRRLHPRNAYGGGTGAGLTIARRIAERHGGRLWLERSVPGEGSTFCLTLG